VLLLVVIFIQHKLLILLLQLLYLLGCGCRLGTRNSTPELLALDDGGSMGRAQLIDHVLKVLALLKE
jgi:hypothetical protein